MKDLACIERILTYRELLPLTGIQCAKYIIPGNFIGIFRARKPSEKVIADVIDRDLKEITRRILNEYKYTLRQEKKRPWGPKTHRPFRGKIDSVRPTLKEQLQKAERAVEELGAPYAPSKIGRPLVHCPKKLAAGLLVKGEKDFLDLATALKEITYDTTINGTGKTASKSTLHAAFQKIPHEWLEKALALLDKYSTEPYEKFDENLDIFGVDGSALSGVVLEKKTVAMKETLQREYYSFTALIRLPTNTITILKTHTNKLSAFLPVLNRGSIVTADPEFDVEENHRAAVECGIDLQVKQKDVQPRKHFRKRARKNFDRKKYRKRKLVERPFGNLTVRGYKMYYRKDKYKGALLIGCAHNIYAYFKNKAWCDQFIKL